jgi:hypothetical protein
MCIAREHEVKKGGWTKGVHLEITSRDQAQKGTCLPMRKANQPG